MDTETVNRVITEITNRLGVGYSVFSDAVSQYAQTKATESLIYSVVFFCAALLTVIIYYFVMWRNSSSELYQLVKCTAGNVLARNYGGGEVNGRILGTICWCTSN